MSTPIIALDLTRQAPHSPRDRIGGFVIASRAIDKCVAKLNGTQGDYDYDSPLDNLLFNFKGITGEQFETVVLTSTNYEDVAAWLQANGTPKTPYEIKKWSDAMEADSPMINMERRAHFIESCHWLRINPETTTTFDWLEADDLASFTPQTA